MKLRQSFTVSPAITQLRTEIQVFTTICIIPRNTPTEDMSGKDTKRQPNPHACLNPESALPMIFLKGVCLNKSVKSLISNIKSRY